MSEIIHKATHSILLENIKNIYRKISSAAIRSGRSPFDVQLVTVTKTVSLEKIQEAVDLGLRLFGENRVQEAQKKIEFCNAQCKDSTIEWHLIGHLQKNKAKTAVHLFDVIQTVDSIELAELINRYAEKNGKTQRILIQVKLSDEESKHGISKKYLGNLIKAITTFKNLRLEGLMTMPPFFDEPERARPYFQELRALRDKEEESGIKLPELSMGMTNDFEVAILEGATMVRIGTAIFGERRHFT
jgi:pyridoxal phosphate enzyme (YggS family)